MDCDSKLQIIGKLGKSWTCTSIFLYPQTFQTWYGVRMTDLIPEHATFPVKLYLKEKYVILIQSVDSE